VHVGRLDESKKIREIIDWAKTSQMKKKINKITLIGTSIGSDSNYIQKLKLLHEKEISEGFLEFMGKISRDKLAVKLDEFSVFVHMFEGSLDKSILESTALGIPVITTNREFIEEFGTWGQTQTFSFDNEFEALLGMKPKDLKFEVTRRKNLVLENHSIEAWACKMATIIKS
jgi:glycosyltransferase involved in cell wall biosynthesis